MGMRGERMSETERQDDQFSWDFVFFLFIISSTLERFLVKKRQWEI